MAILPITLEGRHTILRERTHEVESPIHGGLHRLIQDMIETMNNANGLGIAAQQVNQTERICIIKTKNGDIPLINPKILTKSMRKVSDEEGCLSIPGVYGVVSRAKKITIRSLTPEGKTITIRAEGLLARIIQHEIDHLNGILFVDRVKRLTKTERIEPPYVTLD